MQIVVRTAQIELELDVNVRNPDATMADLLRAASDEAAPDAVYIGSRAIPATTSLSDAGLHEGCELSTIAPHSAGEAAPATGLELAIVAGLDAGRSFAAGRGRSTIGRGSTATFTLRHPTVSREHCAIEIDEANQIYVTDLGSSNYTIVMGGALAPHEKIKIDPGAVLEIGAVAVEIRATKDDRPRGMDLRRHVRPSGTLPFNRPPRPRLAPAPGPVDVPRAPTESASNPFSIASVVGPIILAAVMVAVTDDFRYALFSLLSPIIFIGNWYESRRSIGRKNTRERQTYAERLERLRGEVDRAAEAERTRLRALCPDPAEVVRRAALPSTRVWERRPHHADFLRVNAGIADLEFEAPAKDVQQDVPAEVRDILASRSLPAAPVCIDLARGGVIGIVGDRDAGLACARSVICQAAVHHGPADLTIGVFVDPGRDPDWEWSKWLPHTRNSGGGGGARWLSAQPGQSDALLRSLRRGSATGTLLLVLDSDLLTEGTSAPARELLQLRDQRRTLGESAQDLEVSGIVLASSVDRLPAACNTVIELAGRDGDGTVVTPEEDRAVTDVLVAGMTAETAAQCARHLARFDDPELGEAGVGLPDACRLLPLLDLDEIDSDAIRKRWQQNGRNPEAIAPLGVTEQGRFVLDLVRDGPHGLVGGTTGSGKSELLRSLVAGLAAHSDPTHLTFVLIDYKGGAAFDECARLPHTVGLVTDLDEQLGERALRALEAELHHRERLLRSVRADNLQEYAAKGGDEPLPRLVVVIDEFATMATELPDFISSLVGIAQRGRTLGVHLILATQRPSGAVNDNIRANTNLRIALRVQDPNDSLDIIDSRDAAAITRNRAGRAYVRLGPGETVPIQTALVTCASDDESDAPLDVAPFRFGPTSRSPDEETQTKHGARSDLARLVDAIVEAARAEGIPPPRRPWPEPLPTRIELAALQVGDVTESPRIAFVALADDPARQSQYATGWDLSEGNLLLFGIPGSGTTTTLASLALSLASKLEPGRLEIYALDFGAGELDVLEHLPHTGSVIPAGDRERQMRFIRHLRAELDRRRANPDERVRTVVLMDNFSALRAEFDDPAGLQIMDALGRVYADGPEVSISFAITADRINAIPGAMSAVTTQKWLFRLADRSDYASVGLRRKHLPRPIPGRAVVVDTQQQIQVAMPAPSLAESVAELAARYEGGSTARRIDVLPALATLDDVAWVPDLREEPWTIPVGIRETDLGPAVITLYEGEHITVAGPARSGKSITLWTIAASAKRAVIPPVVFATGGRRSPLRNCPAVDRFAASAGEANTLFAQAMAETGNVLVLIDDAGSFHDADGMIERLVSSALPNVHVAAAASADVLRSLYGHWTKILRQSKVGLLLRPDIDLDGDLLGVTLPRRSPVPMVVGRGYLVQNGEYDIVQIAVDASEAVNPGRR